jgi:hypothetical protein
MAFGNGGKSACTYHGELIGEWLDPERQMARWLIDHHGASPDDVLAVWRDGRPSLTAPLWLLADRRPVEDAKPSPRINAAGAAP